MQDQGYYALPLSNMPMDVSNNVNKMTLFSKPNERIIKLANELYVRNPILVGPTTPSSHGKHKLGVCVFKNKYALLK